MRRCLPFASCVCGSVLLAACGGASGTHGDGAGGAGDLGPGSVNLGSGASGVAGNGSSGGVGVSTNGTDTAGSGHGGTPVTGVTPVDTTTACASQASSANVGVLDMLIVQDTTGSMEDPAAGGTAGESKWTLITNAITSFVNDPASAGIGAGIEFFSDTQANGCSVSGYETPEVPIAPLNGNAGAITGAIKDTSWVGRPQRPSRSRGPWCTPRSGRRVIRPTRWLSCWQPTAFRTSTRTAPACAAPGMVVRGEPRTPLHSKTRTTPPNRASAERPQSPPT